MENVETHSEEISECDNVGRNFAVISSFAGVRRCDNLTDLDRKSEKDGLIAKIGAAVDKNGRSEV